MEKNDEYGMVVEDEDEEVALLILSCEELAESHCFVCSSISVASASFHANESLTATKLLVVAAVVGGVADDDEEDEAAMVVFERSVSNNCLTASTDMTAPLAPPFE